MRPIFWLTMFLACAGSAQACIPQSHQARLSEAASGTTQIAGGVWLPPRPAPGSLPRMPDFTSPVLGPHGGELAAAPARDKNG